VRELLTCFEIDAQLKPIFYSYLGKIFKWGAYFKDTRYSVEHGARSDVVAQSDYEHGARSGAVAQSD
jgi:hypothetical protein